VVFLGDAFWVLLWPALVATFVGVVAALPAGLWIGRTGFRQVQRAEERRRARDLSKAVEALLPSIQWNVERARLLATFVEDRVAFWDTPLEVERWEAVRAMFILNARDVRLQNNAAVFFNIVRWNAERVRLLFEFTMGASAEVPKAQGIGAAMREALLDSLRELQQKGEGLEQELRPLLIEPRGRFTRGHSPNQEKDQESSKTRSLIER
jgi:hypothetical protein